MKNKDAQAFLKAENLSGNELLKAKGLFEWVEQNAVLPIPLLIATITAFDGFRNFQDDALLVLRHGIESGFGKLCYYNETAQFFEDNKQEIIKFLKEFSEATDESSFLTLVSKTKDVQKNDITLENVAEIFYSADASRNLDCYNILANSITWLVASLVCSYYEDFLHHYEI